MVLGEPTISCAHSHEAPSFFSTSPAAQLIKLTVSPERTRPSLNVRLFSLAAKVFQSAAEIRPSVVPFAI